MRKRYIKCYDNEEIILDINHKKMVVRFNEKLLLKIYPFCIATVDEEYLMDDNGRIFSRNDILDSFSQSLDEIDEILK
jgi:hypothetical protein